MLVTLLALAGIAFIPVSVALHRGAKNKAEREARKRAGLIRQRLDEEPRVQYHTVEIRLGSDGNAAGTSL